MNISPRDAAISLADQVRRVLGTTASGLRASYRGPLRRALNAYDQACGGPTFYDRLLEEDLFSEEPAQPETTPTCPTCLNTFTPKRGQTYCSTVCRKTAWLDRQRQAKVKSWKGPDAK